MIFQNNNTKNIILNDFSSHAICYSAISFINLIFIKEIGNISLNFVLCVLFILKIINIKISFLPSIKSINYKITGRSHDSSYTLFRISQSSSEGFKEFTETGRSDTLDAQSQGEGGIFDEFNAPPVTAGEGKTEAEFFVDSNHSRVKKCRQYFRLLFILRPFFNER